MESYIISEICAICSCDTIICPLSYVCKHRFCMTCIYPNRENEILKKCPICRTDDERRCEKDSPIYKLSENTNYEDFYSHFLRKPLKIINQDEIGNLIGKQVVTHSSRYIPAKDMMENISNIGICVAIDGMNITLDNCYYLNRILHEIYPTTPIDRCILVTSDVTIYTEE
jgi:hypothetical protein